MGNFHCIPESCARVVWREYLPPSIRYRYPGEDWQTIEGADDYAIEQEQGKCPAKYHIFGRFVSLQTAYCYQLRWWRTWKAVVGTDVISYSPILFNGVWVLPLVNNQYMSCSTIRQDWWDSRDLRDGLGGGIRYRKYGSSCINVTSPEYGDRLEQYYPIQIIRVDGQPDNCGDCVFKVIKNGETVYQETRSECPEVEQLDCHLSDEYKEIKIEKLPYLKRLEVVDYSIETFGLNIVRGNIPDECLNIYRNDTTGVIPTPVPVPGGIYQSWDYIAQICSAPNCPSPEYTVICGCDRCESCPSDTCAVECDGQICCYNDLGVAVKQIDISNYCG